MFSTEAAWLDWLREDPSTDAKRVFADWLTDHGDERGALLLLDLREQAGEALTHAELSRLVELSRRHGFLRVPDDPDAALVPFEGGGSCPVQYLVDWEGHDYYLRYRHGRFTIEVDDDHDVVDIRLPIENRGMWTYEETNVILHRVSAVLRGGRSWDTLDLSDLEDDPAYRIGPHPRVRTGVDGGTLGARDAERWWRLRDRLRETARGGGS